MVARRAIVRVVYHFPSVHKETALLGIIVTGRLGEKDAFGQEISRQGQPVAHEA